MDGARECSDERGVARGLLYGGKIVPLCFRNIRFLSCLLVIIFPV